MDLPPWVGEQAGLGSEKIVIMWYSFATFRTHPTVKEKKMIKMSHDVTEPD